LRARDGDNTEFGAGALLPWAS